MVWLQICKASLKRLLNERKMGQKRFLGNRLLQKGSGVRSFITTNLVSFYNNNLPYQWLCVLDLLTYYFTIFPFSFKKGCRVWIIHYGPNKSEDSCTEPNQ